MNKPTIVIAHRMRGRIRVKVSHPIRKSEDFIGEIMAKRGIKSVRYNEINKSVLVEYDRFIVSENDVLTQIIVLYSKSYDMIPVRLVYSAKNKNLPLMSIYSLAAISIGGISKYIKSINPQVSEFINWAVVGTTICAIGEHAYNEINERGYFDPEVVSVMYLINSVQKGEFIWPSMVTWITTFGRHIVDMSSGRVIVSIGEYRNPYTGDISYDIKTVPDTNGSKSGSIIRTFAEKFIEIEGNTVRTAKGMNFSDKRGMYGRPGMGRVNIF